MNEWVEYMTFDGISPMANWRRENGHEAAWKLDFFGIGNEPWGCGGNMTAEYYANEYRRYQTYVRQYRNDAKVKKIAAGANGGDYHWTEVLMKNAGKLMDGLSLHHYTIPHDWNHKGSALKFNRDDYFCTLQNALFMDELLRRHGAIMDQYDPEKRVGLIVDEWGTWFDVEEGTNPGFLYQQNTMRDAMVAAIHLDLFNRHCGRVFMANIAQTVNVLQAIILTQEEKMVLTPTYYVFDLYQHHMDAKELACGIEAETLGTEKHSLPGITASASEKDGIVTVTLSNLSPDKGEEVVISAGQPAGKVTGRILQGKMDAYNDFGNAPLKAEAFTDFEIRGGEIAVNMPPCAVAEIRISE